MRPRVGHPDFVGPIDPAFVRRPGAIRLEEDGSAYFELRKQKWKPPQRVDFQAKGGQK